MHFSYLTTLSPQGFKLQDEGKLERIVFGTKVPTLSAPKSESLILTRGSRIATVVVVGQ